MLSPPRPFGLPGIALLLSLILPVEGLDLSNLEEAEKQLEAWVSQRQVDHDRAPSHETGKELAVTLQYLGVVERKSGKPEEALEHLTAASDLLETHSPALRLDCLEAKALTLQDLGRLEESEELLREVLDSRQESTTDEVDHELSATLDHLALNLLNQGKYAEVGPLLEKAIIAAGKDDPALQARLLDHLGRLLHTLGNHSRAIDSFEMALALPFEDPELRLTLKSQIALAQLRLGSIENARIGTEEAADQARELFADDPLRAVPYINNLGNLDLNLGDHEAARTSFAQSLAILESALPSNHQALIVPLNNLGVVEQASGNYPIAEVYLERAATLQREHFPPTHLRVAETQRNLARNALLQGSPDATSKAIEATELGLDILDELIREGSEKERLNFLERFDLLTLPCATESPTLIAEALISSKARLLDAMLSDSDPDQGVTWKDVQQSLQPGTAFVDTCRYFTIVSPVEERYGAVLILPEGLPRWIPLGSAEDLKGWLDAFRNRLAWHSASIAGDAGPPPPIKLRGILKALHRNFWKPIADLLPPDTQHIAYSPAGTLHFMPLSALLDQDNRALSQTYLQVTTVSSGRDLLESSPDRGLNESPWAVLTVSDFPKSPMTDSDDPLLSLLGDLGSMPGTRDEAARLKRLAPPRSVFLTDSDASESALHRLSVRPAVLHLGCHAFFLDNPNASPAVPVDFDERSDLLYSGGLVLYRGAERQLEGPMLSDSDDLLFPSEIARLPLQGTRLVTLSSCESGAGTPVSGEGVLGLQRAFMVAGAREIVVALWPVSDASTPTFMEKFYKRALASNRPAQALWQTQGDFLSAASDDDEFELAVLRYAPFVLSQNTPLVPGPSLPPVEASESDSFLRSHWPYLLAAIPLLLFLIARIAGKGGKRES